MKAPSAPKSGTSLLWWLVGIGFLSLIPNYFLNTGWREEFHAGWDRNWEDACARWLEEDSQPGDTFGWRPGCGRYETNSIEPHDHPELDPSIAAGANS